MTGLNTQRNTMKTDTTGKPLAPVHDGRKGRRHAGRAVVVLVAAAAATLALVGQASAASSIRGCFTYQGVGVAGLGTVVEYYTQNGWQYLGAPARTDSSGCITYNIGAQNMYVRIRAGAPLRDGRTIATAASPYASPGSRSYWLGSTRLGFGTLNTPWWDVTSTWMAEMDNPNCDANPTLLIACYMRSNHMYANPISFPDYDGDGYWDLADRYASDGRYH